MHPSCALTCIALILVGGGVLLGVSIEYVVTTTNEVGEWTGGMCSVKRVDGSFCNYNCGKTTCIGEKLLVTAQSEECMQQHLELILDHCMDRKESSAYQENTTHPCWVHENCGRWRVDEPEVSSWWVSGLVGAVVCFLLGGICLFLEWKKQSKDEEVRKRWMQPWPGSPRKLRSLLSPNEKRSHTSFNDINAQREGGLPFLCFPL